MTKLFRNLGSVRHGKLLSLPAPLSPPAPLPPQPLHPCSHSVVQSSRSDVFIFSLILEAPQSTMQSAFHRRLILATLLLLCSEASGAPIRQSETKSTSPFLAPLTGAVIFAVAVGWVLVFTAAGAVARGSDQAPDLPFPNLTPCTNAGNALKNLLEVVFVFPCCASLKCSFTIGIWLARGSPLMVLLKVALASLSSGTLACVLGYVGAYLARDNSSEIQVTWGSLSDDRVKRTVPSPTQPYPHMSTLMQACLVASLPLVVVACALPFFNGLIAYFTPKVGRAFSLCLVTGVAFLLAAGVFLTAFSISLLGPGSQPATLSRHKRAAYTSAEVESLLGIDLGAAHEPSSSSLSPRTPTTPVPTLPTFEASPAKFSLKVSPMSIATESSLPLNVSAETDEASTTHSNASSVTKGLKVSQTTDTDKASGPTPAEDDSTLVTTPAPVDDSSSSPALIISTKADDLLRNHSTTISTWLDSAESWVIQNSPQVYTQFCKDRSSLLGLCVGILLALRIASSLHGCTKTFKKNKQSQAIGRIVTHLIGLNDKLSALTEAQPPSADFPMDEINEVPVFIPPPPPPPPASNLPSPLCTPPSAP